MPLDNCLQPRQPMPERPTMQGGPWKAVAHPIYDPGPRYDVLRAAMNRINGEPQHPDDYNFRECRTEYGKPVCSCGHYAVVWPTL